jgi:hypothetical protein
MLLQTPLALNENVTTKEDAAVNINPLAANTIVAGVTPQLNITQSPANGGIDPESFDKNRIGFEFQHRHREPQRHPGVRRLD